MYLSICAASDAGHAAARSGSIDIENWHFADRYFGRLGGRGILRGNTITGELTNIPDLSTVVDRRRSAA